MKILRLLHFIRYFCFISPSLSIPTRSVSFTLSLPTSLCLFFLLLSLFQVDLSSLSYSFSLFSLFHFVQIHFKTFILFLIYMTQWYTDTLIHWYTNTLIYIMHWYIDTLIHWYTDTLEHWYIPLIHWYTDIYHWYTDTLIQ